MPVRGSCPGALPEGGLGAASAWLPDDLPVLLLVPVEELELEPLATPEEDAMGLWLELPPFPGETCG